MASEKAEANEGIDYLLIGGGKEQEGLAEELRRRGRKVASIKYEEIPAVDSVREEIKRRGGMETLANQMKGSDKNRFISDHPTVEALLRGSDEALFSDLQLIDEAKEYMDPISYRRVYESALEQRLVWFPQIEDTDKIRGLSDEELGFLLGEFKEYHDLKGMYQELFVRDNTTLSLSVDSVKSTLERMKKGGAFMEVYGRFCHRLLAAEMKNQLALNQQKTEAERYNDHGNELNLQGRFDDALEYFDRAIELSPHYCLPRVNKGIALKNLERVDESISVYNETIRINPRYKKAWHNKAVALWAKGEIDEARTCVDRALQIDPNYSVALRLKTTLS